VLAGTSNPFLGGTVKAGDQVATSDSIVTVPLFEPSTGPSQPPDITVIGFLQLFINDVDSSPANGGQITATIMNVAGCDKNVVGNPVQGASSTLPVRLIHE
jgi:hypothetical protein